MNEPKLRPYKPGDWQSVYRVLYAAVHAQTKDYSLEQLSAWAPEKPDANSLQRALADNHSFVVDANGTILGFASLGNQGFLSHLYVAPSHQNQGIGTLLLNTIEEQGRKLGLSQITVVAGMAARAFFEQHGYAFQRKSTERRRGVSLPFIVLRKDLELPAVDWQQQWALHGQNFHDGLAHIPLDKQEFVLRPGPGFGDCSHPTTRLTLAALQAVQIGGHILDVGCGSGVLSIAAALLGAQRVTGIDIDAEALDHARENAQLNQVGGVCTFMLPGSVDEPADLLVINMISSEQSVAWQSLVDHGISSPRVISSGILLEQREAHLSTWRERGYRLKDESCEAGWCCFLLELATPSSS